MTTAPDAAQIARTNMVESQIRPNRVHDADLLNAMLNVPREAFVPSGQKSIAYADEALKIAPGRYLTEPLVTARLLDAAGINSTDHILVIGAGTGYTSLLASLLGGSVVALEQDDSLRDYAVQALVSFHRSNLTVTGGAMIEGYPADAPYDVIVIDGQVAAVPQPILNQLADGGRLVTVLLGNNGPHGVLIERTGSAYSTRTCFDAGIPLLPGFEPLPRFEFSS